VRVKEKWGKEEKKRKATIAHWKIGREVEKFLKLLDLFSTAGRNAFLVLVSSYSPSPPSLSLCLSSGSIYRRHISSREISRAISATDFYAAIILRFSFLFSSSCASFYAHSHIRLLSSGSGRWVDSPHGKSVRRILSLYLSVPLFTR